MTQTWLIDKSALVRLGRAESDIWAQRIYRGSVHITTVTMLELAYSVRNAEELARALNGTPVASMPCEYFTPAIEKRAIEVMTALAARGHHRAPCLPDLLIAAAAELNGHTVLHADKDFELISAVTGQSVERLNG